VLDLGRCRHQTQHLSDHYQIAAIGKKRMQ